MSTKQIKKIVLAYSGGLDTTVILHWLKETYNAEVITFTADIGQDHNPDLVKERVNAIGASKVILEDLKEEFVQDYVCPMFRSNTVYECEYLLCTSIARPLISKRMIEIAEEEGADAIAHGATGKGNDQIRFEIGAYSLNPSIEVIAPWRTWDFVSRADLIDYCKKNQINIDTDPDEPMYSTDENILHTSYEGEILEDPSIPAPESIWQRTSSLKEDPDKEQEITKNFENGDPIGLDGKDLDSSQILDILNDIGGKNGIGRLDLVENRFTGMKSRGCYETPGGTILIKAHRAIESLSLDAQTGHLKDELMPKYAQLIYDGFWWSPERETLQTLINKTQTNVNGIVRLKLFKGSVYVTGRKSSSDSLFDEAIATFEDDSGVYDQKDADGFIKLNALRLKLQSKRK